MLFKPTRYGGTSERKPSFMRQHTLPRHLSLALSACSLPSLTWYQATRHTFASHWVLSGGSLEKLANVMAHSSVVVTERYAHLKPDLFREEDYERLDIDLVKPAGRVLALDPGTKRGHVAT
jgi:integrase